MHSIFLFVSVMKSVQDHFLFCRELARSLPSACIHTSSGHHHQHPEDIYYWTDCHLHPPLPFCHTHYCLFFDCERVFSLSKYSWDWSVLFYWHWSPCTNCSALYHKSGLLFPCAVRVGTPRMKYQRDGTGGKGTWIHLTCTWLCPNLCTSISKKLYKRIV